MMSVPTCLVNLSLCRHPRFRVAVQLQQKLTLTVQYPVGQKSVSRVSSLLTTRMQCQRLTKQHMNLTHHWIQRRHQVAAMFLTLTIVLRQSLTKELDHLCGSLFFALLLCYSLAMSCNIEIREGTCGNVRPIR